MGKYHPTFDWVPAERVTRAVCGMCPDVEIAPSVAGARAHLLAHRDHVVALVVTTTTLLHVLPDGEEITGTRVSVRQEWSSHVPG